VQRMIAAIIATLGLATAQANAAVSVLLDAADLWKHDGITLAPQSTVGLLIDDKNNDGISNGPLVAGLSLAVGSSFGGADNVIVNRTTILAGGLGQDGLLEFAAVFPLGGGVAAGDHLTIVWMPNQINPSGPANVGWYGWYKNPFWIIPADGGYAIYDMLTESEGGTVPDSAGIAGYAIIPEPAGVTLLSMGCLGLVGLVRRRSEAKPDNATRRSESFVIRLAQIDRL
jgi:hypothetical protein